MNGRRGYPSEAFKKEVEGKIESLERDGFIRRLYECDPSLWSNDPKTLNSIINRLGWIKAIPDFQMKIPEIEGFAFQVKRAGFRHVVLLGMGGSSLCAEVCRNSFGHKPGLQALIVLDNTSPEALRMVESSVDIERTIFIVASKSGTTTETISFYNYFYSMVGERLGKKGGYNFVAITDPGTPLCKEAKERCFFKCFENPVDIGGRYSAISYFGLVPLSLMGIDLKEFLKRARKMYDMCSPHVPLSSNPGVKLGIELAVARDFGMDKVTFCISPPISSLGCWLEQLIAESTGKGGNGIVPVDGEAPGPPYVYGKDRIFVSITMEGSDEGAVMESVINPLEEVGHPVIRIEIKDLMDLGAEFFRWEVATATAGSIMGINPFDEPDVAQSKDNTRQIIEEWKHTGVLGEGLPQMKEGGLSIYYDTGQIWAHKTDKSSIECFIESFLDLARPPDYVALLPYFMKTTERNQILESIRKRIRDRLKVATTIGYGPRYLHSTGQLHKGGPNTGVFVIITVEPKDDVMIPGEVYGFSVLQRAQAIGDFRSLVEKGRRVIRIHMGEKIEEGLQRFYNLLK